jgi:hypothetical protein
LYQGKSVSKEPKTIQFVIEMPVPAHLVGFPYDEIEYHFMTNYMYAAKAYMLKEIVTKINNQGVVVLEDTSWLESAQNAKLIIAK